MAEQGDGFSRRNFLKGAAGAAVASAALGRTKAHAAGKQAATKSKVVLIRDEKVIDKDGKVDPQVIAKMLDDGVCKLLGEKKPAAAFARLIRPEDTVGIKSNVWRFLATPPELEQALKQRIIEAGVSEERIGVDDRGVLGHPVFKKATALINVRPLRTHHWSGVGGLIKNPIMFSPQPWLYHGDSCADLAKIWELPEIKGKVRLNILVMLTPLFHGKGPHHYNARYTWPYKGMIIATDPVAADAVGLRILEAKRRAFFGKAEPFATSTKHIQVAETKFKLGVADPKKIDLVKLGWSDGILI